MKILTEDRKGVADRRLLRKKSTLTAHSVELSISVLRPAGTDLEKKAQTCPTQNRRARARIRPLAM
jgi:hypothetical protein